MIGPSYLNPNLLSPPLTDSEQKRASGAYLITLAQSRFPPNLVEWNSYLEPLLDPNFDPQMRASAIRFYALLSWQLEAHSSDFGLH